MSVVMKWANFLKEARYIPLKGTMLKFPIGLNKHPHSNPISEKSITDFAYLSILNSSMSFFPLSNLLVVHP